MANSASSRTTDALPLPRTHLIGREAELAAARAVLLDEAIPLLTLAGLGGVGKTRLALAVAQDLASHFADGIRFVDVSPVSDAALLLPIIATALGIPLPADRPPMDVVLAHLRAQQLLLILDNCEQIITAVAELVATLLTRCPAIQILVTSRTPIQVRGERLLRVLPLPIPGPAVTALETIQDVPAVALFVHRARAAEPHFTLTAQNAGDVATLCRQLDGLPLAIELAAARSRVFSPSELLAQMTDRLTLLRDGPRDLPVRQQTLETTIAWSSALLSADAQTLLRRLAVFVGGFTREAAATAMSSEEAGPSVLRALTQLVDHNLVHRLDLSVRSRFTMLETVRAFAFAQLEANDEVTLARTALVTYLTEFGASVPPDAYFGPEQLIWYPRIDAEIDNIRAAMAWLMEIGDGQRTLHLLVAFDDYWSARRYRAESRRWAEFGLASALDAPPELRAQALHIAVFSARAMGDFAAALVHAEAGLAVAQTLDDPVTLGRAYYQLGNAWHHLDVWRAAAATEQAVAVSRSTGDTNWLGVVLADWGDKLHTCGEIQRAAHLIDEGLAINRTYDHTWGIAQALGQRGHLARAEGKHQLATQCFLELIPLAQKIGDEHMVMGAVAGVAGVALDRGQPQRAAHLLGAVMAEQERTGWPRVAHPLNVARITDAVRAALGEIAFASAIAAGQAIPFADALDDAVAIDQPRTLDIPMKNAVHRQQERRPVLTPREQEVLVLLCKRRTNAEIAEELFLSPRTIETHVTHLLSKLEATNRRDVGAIAVRLGLI